MNDTRGGPFKPDPLEIASHHSRRIKAVLIAVIVVLSVGILGYAWSLGTPMKYPDERQYVEIATSLVQGQGFELNGLPTAYRPPVWPMVIAFFLAIGLPQSLLSVVPALAMIAAAVVASILGVRFTRSPWGAVVGVLMLLYPLNIYTAVRLYPQALATLFVVLIWLAADWSVDGQLSTQRRRLAFIATGLIGSLLALSVPTLAFTALAVCGWVVWRSKHDRLAAVSCALGAFVAPICVWMVRNASVLGGFVPLSTSNGVNLILGNSPNTTGSSGVDVDISGPASGTAGMGEVERDAFLRDKALEWIVSNPSDALSLYASKVLNYFSPYNQPVTAAEGGAGLRWIAILSFLGLVTCVFFRLWLTRYLPVRPSESLFLSLFIVNAFVMALHFTRTRFRQPLDSILVVEAGIGVILGLLVLLARKNKRAGTVLRD